jgi:perosamine synthetase
VPRDSFTVTIAKPEFGDKEIEAVTEVLLSGRLIQGPRVEAFERAFATVQGANFAIATSSGTTALTAALLAHGIGPEDEVIVPAFSFCATAAAVVSVGARPVFVDIEPATYGICPCSLQATITRRTRAVIVAHLFGHLAQMNELSDWCRERELILIEDAAQAHGASMTDAGSRRRAGSWGTACFSFHASKNLTTGEGGMVLTQHAFIAQRIQAIRNHGRNEQGTPAQIGFNFRMTELAAALGLVQLTRFDELQSKRLANADYLRQHLREVSVPKIRDGFEHAFHQFTVRAKDRSARDALLARLHAEGFEARVYYSTPLPHEPRFAGFKSEHQRFGEAESAAECVLSLPVHASVTAAQRDAMVACVNRVR